MVLRTLGITAAGFVATAEKAVIGLVKALVVLTVPEEGSSSELSELNDGSDSGCGPVPVRSPMKLWMPSSVPLVRSPGSCWKALRGGNNPAGVGTLAGPVDQPYNGLP